MLYTRTGDGGTSGLFGTKERKPKSHPTFEALGSVDELNALVGLVRAYVRERGHAEMEEQLSRVQEALFVVQAELAGADKHITRAHVENLETVIGNIEAVVTKPTSFVIPGATMASALFDFARTVARRAERAVLSAREEHELPAELRAYLNRLSSLFYALARQAAQSEDAAEQSPTYDIPT